MLQDIKNKALAINDDLWGENFLLCCLKQGVVDPERAEIMIRGILRMSGDRTQKADGGKSNGWHVPVNATSSTLYIDRMSWPNLIVKVGDKVKALERVGEIWFKVVSVNDRDYSRLKLELGEV